MRTRASSVEVERRLRQLMGELTFRYGLGMWRAYSVTGLEVGTGRTEREAKDNARLHYIGNLEGFTNDRRPTTAAAASAR